jgi:hypothetical protein
MGKEGVFTGNILGQQEGVECWNWKIAIVGMCGSLFGAVKCMKKQVVRPVE